MRGITITLMIIGHLIPYASFPFNIIYSFHMPIFFFLSGYCSSKSMLSADRIHFGKFIVKKLKAIYVPLLVLRIVLNILTSNTQAMLANPLLFVYNPGDWFLQTLFWGDILFFGYMALCRRFSHPSVKLFLPIVWGALSTYFLDISRVWGPIVHPYLPFYFGVLALCFTFMLAGHLLAQSGDMLDSLAHNFSDEKSKSKIYIPFALILCVFGIIGLLYIKDNEIINVSTTYIGTNYPMFFAIAFLLIYVVYIASKAMSLSSSFAKFFAFWGRNSLYVYIVHSFVHYSLNLIIEKFTGVLYTPMIDLPWYFCILYFVLDFAIIIPYILLHNKIKKSLKSLFRSKKSIPSQ